MKITELDNNISNFLKEFESSLEKIDSDNYTSILEETIGFKYLTHPLIEMIATKTGKSNINSKIPNTPGIYIFTTNSTADSENFTNELQQFKKSNPTISLPNRNKNKSSKIIYIGSALKLRSRLTAHLNYPNEGVSTYALHLGKFHEYSKFNMNKLNLEIFYFDEVISTNTQLSVKKVTENKLYAKLRPLIGNNR